MSVHICRRRILESRSFNKGGAIVAHRNELVFKLRSNSTLESEHVVTVTLELQPYRGIELVIVFHHPFFNIFLEIARFFGGVPKLDDDEHGSSLSLLCPHIAIVQTKFCPDTNKICPEIVRSIAECYQSNCCHRYRLQNLNKIMTLNQM